MPGDAAFLQPAWNPRVGFRFKARDGVPSVYTGYIHTQGIEFMRYQGFRVFSAHADTLHLTIWLYMHATVIAWSKGEEITAQTRARDTGEI